MEIQILKVLLRIWTGNKIVQIENDTIKIKLIEEDKTIVGKYTINSVQFSFVSYKAQGNSVYFFWFSHSAEIQLDWGELVLIIDDNNKLKGFLRNNNDHFSRSIPLNEL